MRSSWMASVWTARRGDRPGRLRPFPNQIAVGGIERQDAGSRTDEIHDAAVHEGDAFLNAGCHSANPFHPKLPDILPRDLA